MKVSTAAILAAGIGSRLRPITNNLPKCMVKVNGKPILGYQLEAFKKEGITDIKIVVGYESEKIIQYCQEFRGLKIEIIRNEDYENNNNMYSMYLLQKYLKGKEFIFCNADVIYDQAIIRSIANAHSNNYIAVDVGTYDEESMKVTLNENGIINGIKKTFNKKESYGRSVDLYRINSEASEVFFDAINTIINVHKNVREWTEVVIDRLSAEGHLKFLPLNINGSKWTEIDDYNDLSKADKLFSDFDLNNYKAVFLDIDGTLTIGSRLIEGAQEFIKQLKDNDTDYYFVTNNSSKSKEEYVRRLEEFGLEAKEKNIVLSTDGLIQYLVAKGIEKVYCLGTNSMKSELLKHGIVHDEESPEYVVVGYDTELTYDKLRQACKWINKGVNYLLTHIDVFCPSDDGPIPDIGALSECLKLTTNREPINIFGKPNIGMLSHLVGKKYSSNEVLFIGDRLYTDKVLADRLGIDFVCVLSGETIRSDLQKFSEVDWPKLVLKDISEINWKCSAKLSETITVF